MPARLCPGTIFATCFCCEREADFTRQNFFRQSSIFGATEEKPTLHFPATRTLHPADEHQPSAPRYATTFAQLSPHGSNPPRHVAAFSTAHAQEMQKSFPYMFRSRIPCPTGLPRGPDRNRRLARYNVHRPGRIFQRQSAHMIATEKTQRRSMTWTPSRNGTAFARHPGKINLPEEAP